MQLNKILITLAFLLLTLNSIAYSKNMKSKYTSNLLASKNRLEKSTADSHIKTDSTNKNLEKSTQNFYNEKFNYNFNQAYALFKQVAKNLFTEKQAGMLDNCIDLVSGHLTNQEAVFKSFWLKMSDIYEENQLKSRLQSTPTALQNQSFNKLNDWKKILISEFQNIINNVVFEQRLKNECAKIFSDSTRNVFDLLFLLGDPKFFGGRFMIVDKNHQFIDSMFSVHRNQLADNAFEKLNAVSSNYMQFNNDQLRSIMAKRSYIPPSGNGKKLSPYASDVNFDFSKVIKKINFYIKFLNHLTLILYSNQA